MKAKSTYGEFVETLVSLLGLLGVVLCLQVGVLQAAAQDDLPSVRHEHKQCCVQVASDQGHAHAQSSPMLELSVVATCTQEVIKIGGNGAAATFQKAFSLHQHRSYTLELRDQLAIFLLTPLLTDRHIRFRRIII